MDLKTKWKIKSSHENIERMMKLIRYLRELGYKSSSDGSGSGISDERYHHWWSGTGVIFSKYPPEDCILMTLDEIEALYYEKHSVEPDYEIY